MFVTRKIWAITVPCIVLFCFSNPVRGEADSVSWENLSEHLAQESIPLLQLNVSNCPNKIENLEPSRVAAQIIENTFYLWEEYDILTEEGVETLCIVMKKPNPGSLSKEESQILLTASSLWKESKPRPEDAIILDASDPSLNLRPIEDLYTDEDESFQPEDVIGSEDDRKRITDTTSYPWNTHCFLHLDFPDDGLGPGWRGTGCLVSPYMVLTCGHNVYNQYYSDFVTNVTIAPGQKQSYEGGSVTRPYATREGVDFQTNSSYISGGSWEHDYGAVFFSSPFSGINTFMPLEWSGPSVGETVYVAGYAKEVKLGTPDAEANSQALWNDSDPVHSYSTQILQYTVDTSGGQSGSPVLKKNYVMDPGRIIAIHAFGNATANGGPRLRSDNRTLITEWMQWTPSCSPPTGVSASDGTYTDKVQITWNSVSSPCNYYRVYRAESSAGTKTALGSSCQTSTTYNDNTSTPGITYYYWVKSAKDSSCSGASDYSSYNTGWRKLSPPTGVSASHGNYTDRVCVTWNGVSGANYYRVYRDISPTGTKTPLGNWQTLTSYCDYTAELGITYYYWVEAAVGSDGYRASDYSAYDSGWRSVTRTLTVASSDPNSGVSIMVSPSDNNGQSNGITGFTRIYNNNTAVTLTAPSTVDGNSFKEWQLNDAYWTDALTANVTMDADYTLTTVYVTPLNAPVLNEEPNMTPGLCNTIYWDSVPEAKAYYAECANDANFTNIDANSGWITKTSYQFSGLTGCQEYWYRVKSGSSAWSQTSQAEFRSDTLIDTTATSGGDVVLAQGTTILFEDDFEDADMIGWTPGAGSYTREVTDATAAAGSLYSITLIGGGASQNYDGVSHNLTAITPDNITFYVRSSDASKSDGYFVVGTGPSTSATAVFFFTKQDGQMGVYDGTTFWGTSYSSLTWYKIRFAFNWTSKNIDYYVNDTLVKSGINFRSTSVSSLTKVYLYNFSNSQAWWDEIEFFTGSSGGYTPIGNIVSAPIDLPADGTWGIVDFNTTTPPDTELTVDILPAGGTTPITGYENVPSGADLGGISATTIRVRANLATNDPNSTPALHDWSVTYTDPAGIKSLWSNVESSIQVSPGDFEPDCDVDFSDFAILGLSWLSKSGDAEYNPKCDIAVPADNLVDMRDIAVLAEHWLEGVE